MSQGLDIDAEIPAAGGTKMAKGLDLLLRAMMVVLGLGIVFMVSVTLIMLIPSGLRENLLAEYAANDGAPFKPSYLVGACISGAAIAAAYFVVVRILHKIVGTLLAGDPFVPANISRLRKIWMIIAAAEIFRMITKLILSTGPNSDISGEGMTFDIRIITWFLVFVIAALAEVFRHGAELRRDQEFTI